MPTLRQTLLSHGLDEEEARAFEFLTQHFQSGKATAQVPLLSFAPSSGADEIDFDKLFKNNDLVWATPQGVIRTKERQNPDNKRKLSGHLFMSAQYLERFLPLMYEVFMENNTRETTVTNEKEFLALIVTPLTFAKAPKDKERLDRQYLDLCDKLYPGEDIINDRLKTRCPGSSRIKVKYR